MTAIATLQLDVCTPEGHTWCARLTGISTKYTFDREFVNASSSDLSGSGKTGSKTYTLVENGIYQSREGRRRLRDKDGRDSAGNCFYRVTAGEITVIDQAEAITALRGGAR